MAVFGTSNLPLGQNQVTAEYSGFGSYASSVTEPGSAVINTPIAVNEFGDPTSFVALGSGGNIFVSLYGMSYQDVVEGQGDAVSVFAGGGYAGAYPYTGSATAIGLGDPAGLAFYNGTLYLADNSSNIIYAVNVASDAMTTYAGNGEYTGSTSDGMAATARSSMVRWDWPWTCPATCSSRSK